MAARPREPKTSKHSGEPTKTTARIAREIAACERCVRLRVYCREIARKKRRAYLDWDYWGRPVPGFGDARARMWLVGLAPGAHGANRTGRMFTGDASGDWLYEALHAFDFAKQPESLSRDDGQRLYDAYVSSAVRCAPPDNKPTTEEIHTCAPFLHDEMRALRRVRVIVTLGLVGYQATLRLLAEFGYVIPTPKPRFGHLAEYEFSTADGRGRRVVLASYHPSRQNTQTGKLSRAMWHGVFRRARKLVGPRP